VYADGSESYVTADAAEGSLVEHAWGFEECRCRTRSTSERSRDGSCKSEEMAAEGLRRSCGQGRTRQLGCPI
jgi:hypothetical protein